MVSKAFLVIAQHLENATVGDPIRIARSDHPLQFNAECLEPHKPCLDFAELPLGDSIDLSARTFGRV